MKNNDQIVITKTPLRVSFVGGGTDMPYFYNKFEGTTISCCINNYIYVTAKFHNNYQEKYRLNYSSTENTNSIEKIKNLRIKKTIKKLLINKPLYINTFADLPSNSGLGSSSSFTVGLIKALAKLQKKELTTNQIAELAFNIESEITNKSIGKQDHYIAAYGGLNFTKYSKKDVSLVPLNLNPENFKSLNESMILVWTGITRSASEVLQDQKKNLKKNFETLNEIKKYCLKFKNELGKKKIDNKKIGKIISKSWNLKKKFSKYVSTNLIDKIYNSAIKNGAYGGKLLGAGNGGFLLFILPKSKKKMFKKKLRKFKTIVIEIEKSGSTFL